MFNQCDCAFKTCINTKLPYQTLILTSRGGGIGKFTYAQAIGNGCLYHFY